MMERILLVKTASWLYHTDNTNPVRFEINKILDKYGLHPQTKITCTINEGILFYIEKYKQYTLELEQKNKRYNKRKKK
ncbi:MAG: hypothetical protein ACXACY_12975 [Candidatus Hodarchaeales archaeon]|jgi:hypothetical protein